MFQIDTSTAASVEPTPGAPGTPGYFTEGDPVTNVPATIVSADWLNAITDELLAILAAASIAPAKATHDQVVTAINLLISTKFGNAFQVYAGNPTGHIAGTAGTAGSVFPTVVWDITNNIWWVCITTGSSSTAVWTEAGSPAAWPFWCGTSTGTANAQSVATPVTMLTFGTGTSVSWQVGVGLTNTGPTILTVGSFGTISLRKDGPTGPIALAGGELVAGNIVLGRFDGTYIQVAATELGTAALKNTGNTIIDPGTGSLEIASPIVPQIGTNYAFVAVNRGCTINRSNSGTNMADSLPASMANGWWVDVINSDATAGLVLTAPGGTYLNGVNGGSISVAPGQFTSFSADSSGNLWTTVSPIFKGKVSHFSGSITLTAVNHLGCFSSTATGTINVPKTTTTFNGFAFSAHANAGTITLVPDAADSFNGGTAGASYLIPNGTSACFVGDGGGNIDVFYQTAVPGASPAPQYISTSQTISSGQYAVDTSGVSPSVVPLSLTLPASPPTGTPIVLMDAQDTWAINNVALVSGGGGNTINGSSSNFALDVSGAQVLLIYKSGNWEFE